MDPKFDERVAQFLAKVHAKAEPAPHFVEFYNQVVYDVMMPALFCRDELPTLYQRPEWQEFMARYEHLARSGSRWPSQSVLVRVHHPVTITPRVPLWLNQQLSDDARELGISKNQLYLRKLAEPIYRKELPSDDHRDQKKDEPPSSDSSSEQFPGKPDSTGSDNATR